MILNSWVDYAVRQERETGQCNSLACSLLECGVVAAV